MNTVLIVDDDSLTCSVLAALLERTACSPLVCANAEDALKLLKHQKVDLIITDLNMSSGMSGLDLIKRLPPDLDAPVILMTGYAAVSVAVDVMRAGAFDMVTKPLRPRELLELIKTALQVGGRLSEDAQAYNPEYRVETHFGVLVGESPPMQALYRGITLVAKTDLPVNLHAGSGSDKLAVARILHAESHRAAAAMYAVDLQTEPLEVLQDAFVEKYLQVDGQRTKSAPPPTVFLDNVECCTPALQRDILREETAGRGKKERSKQGSAATPATSPRARLLVGSQKTPAQLATVDGLNPEFVRLISLLGLQLPPLSECVSDIPLVAHHYLRQLKGQGGSAYSLSCASIDLLKEHPWPGDIAELRKVLDGAVAGATLGELITVAVIADLIGGIAKRTGATSNDARRGRNARAYVKAQGENLDELLAQ